MGTVYRAFDTGLMRDVAIKVIRREVVLDPEARGRFDQEAKSAGMLKHPGIVTIYDRAERDGQPYIVMEFVEGQTLDHLIKDSHLTTAQVIAILKQVASALDYAHARQVVHRDIKPSNIMVQSEGGAKVMDFGIAKADLGSGSLTATGMMVGSPQYVPPERYVTGLVSGATDQWALAITAYEAFTGRRPFQGATWDTLTYQICNQPAPDPTEFKPEMPKRASTALLKALSKNPEDRFATCCAFVEALEAGFVSETGNLPAPVPPPPVIEPAPAPPPPPPSPPARVAEPIMVRGPGNKTKPIWLAGAAALAVLAVLTGVVWFAKHRSATTSNPEVHKTPPEVRKPSGPAGVLETPTGDMVLVPAGPTLIGRENAITTIDTAFYIDRTEVSAGTYKRFLQETGRMVPPEIESSAPDHPAANVSWNDARTFAEWAQKRLPTALEWEKAARGEAGQQLPWNGSAAPERANVPIDRASAANRQVASVTSYPEGVSPYGALNMIGNVWEWTSTPTAAPPPDQIDQLRRTLPDLNPPVSETEAFYQVRGGGYQFATPLNDWPSLVWDYSRLPARARRPHIGFRCVRDAP